MTGAPPTVSGSDASPTALARLLRERDQLFQLHEALAEVEGAHEKDERLRILVEAVKQIGYGRVATIEGAPAAESATVMASISHS